MNNSPHIYSNKCVFSSIEDIKDKKVTVMGLGLNGGGEASVRFFLKSGAYVTVTDIKNEEQLKTSIKSLEDDKSLDKSRLTYKLGGHFLEDFADADCVIKNPVVKIKGNRFLAAAKAVETDISIFLRFTKAPIIAVTGSKGKSSTVSAAYYGLNKAGIKSFLGGNITVSPLSFLEETTEVTPVILELSSWQLSDLRGRGILKPKIALITKIVPDHQNWYSNMEDYLADKKLIYADQSSSDYSIFELNSSSCMHNNKQINELCKSFAKETNGKILYYSSEKLPSNFYGVWQDTDEIGNFCGKVLLEGMEKPEIILRNLKVPGSHMKTNALNAALIMYLMGISSAQISSTLAIWQGAAHRLQYFHTYIFSNKNFSSRTEIHFYNDSCSTIPQAAAAAVQAFDIPVILITGGTDKELCFAPLVKTISESSKILHSFLYLLDGTGTDKLIRELKQENIEYSGVFLSLEELLEQLKEDIKNSTSISNFKKVSVVFSPASASFGMFANEFDRGNQFMSKVKRIFFNELKTSLNKTGC